MNTTYSNSWNASSTTISWFLGTHKLQPAPRCPAHHIESHWLPSESVLNELASLNRSFEVIACFNLAILDRGGLGGLTN